MTNQIKYKWATLVTGVIADHRSWRETLFRCQSLRQRSSLRRNIVKRFMKRLTKSLKTLKWILSISQRAHISRKALYPLKNLSL